MDKLIRENLDGKYLTVYSGDFNKSIQFAFENKLPQIQILGLVGDESIDHVIDFKEIEKLSPYLKILSFHYVFKNKIINFDSIYSLKKLEKYIYKS
jgi:hypothetical protein